MMRGPYRSAYCIGNREHDGSVTGCRRPVASFTKEVSSRLAKRPLVCNGRLANHGLTSLVKEATGCIVLSPGGLYV